MLILNRYNENDTTREEQIPHQQNFQTFVPSKIDHALTPPDEAEPQAAIESEGDYDATAPFANLPLKVQRH